MHRTATLLLFLLPALSCKDSTAPELGPEIQLEESAATRATVGPEGGSLSATAADGTRYTLTVPQGALLEEIEISLTPLGDIEHFPGGEAPAAGAHFEPDGLRFYVPATLTVELPGGSDAQAYTGFTYRGEGAELHLYPTTAQGTTLSYAVVRFSGYGLSQLSLAEIANFPSPSNAGALAQQALVQLLAASAAGQPVEDEEFVDLVRFWYTDVLRPALIAAESDPGADDGAYLTAELEYLVWQRAVLLYHPFLGTLLDAERAEAASLLAGAIRGAIDAHNQRCRDANDLGEAFTVARFQRVAASFGFDGVGEFGLDPASVRQTFCLAVVVEELDFPATIGPGEAGTLDLRAGYQIEGHPVGFTSFLLIDVFASAGNSGDQLSGTTSQAGHYAATVTWPAGESALTLDISACLDWGGLFPEMEVCEERQLVRGAQTVGRYVLDDCTSAATAGNYFLVGGGNDDIVFSEEDEEFVVCDDVASSSGSASVSRSGSEDSTSVTTSSNASFDLAIDNDDQSNLRSITFDGSAGSSATVTGATGTTYVGASGRVEFYGNLIVEGEPVSFTLRGTVGPHSRVRLYGGAAGEIVDIYPSVAGGYGPGPFSFSGVLEAGLYFLSATAHAPSLLEKLSGSVSENESMNFEFVVTP